MTMASFFDAELIEGSTWQAFEKTVLRLLTLMKFESTWRIGQSGDGGADVIASRRHLATGKEIRWLVQVKKYSSKVGVEVVDETVRAGVRYGANILVIASVKGFNDSVYARQARLADDGITLQLWDADRIEELGQSLENSPPIFQGGSSLELRPYQTRAIEALVEMFYTGPRAAMIVLATGLGKTVTAAEAIRRIRETTRSTCRVLVLAHTIDLVEQLERSFWPFMRPTEASIVLTGNQRPSDISDLKNYAFVFSTRDSMAALLRDEDFSDLFEFVVVDECHHLGSDVYEFVLDNLNAGRSGGPFLLGLTATPWRPDGTSLDERFGDPLVSVDLAQGLRDGYLSNVDYRMFTDDVDWQRLKEIEGERFTPEKINRTLFITEWDNAVIERTMESWREIGSSARGIVFCGTIDHAYSIAAKINALGFTTAEVAASRTRDNRAVSPVDRAKLLWDFASGKIGILCAVDVLNEGIDVPDVNLVVFQRVTHSRRIFVQQLGRGLRIKEGKDKVIVLDFVTDIRRFAEGMALERALEVDGPKPGDVRVVKLGSSVRFFRHTSEDSDSRQFLGEWLGDLEAVAAAGEDISILSFPRLDSLPAG